MAEEFDTTGSTLHGPGYFKFGDIFLLGSTCEDIWQDPTLTNVEKWYKIFLYDDLGSDELESILPDIHEWVARSDAFEARRAVVEENLLKLSGGKGVATAPDGTVPDDGYDGVVGA